MSVGYEEEVGCVWGGGHDKVYICSYVCESESAYRVFNCVCVFVYRHASVHIYIHTYKRMYTHIHTRVIAFSNRKEREGREGGGMEGRGKEREEEGKEGRGMEGKGKDGKIETKGRDGIRS